MKRKMKKLWALLRSPDQLKRYALWLGAQTKPFLPSLLVMAGIDLLAVLIGFGSSFVSKDVVDTATVGQPYTRAFAMMITLTFVSIGVGVAVGLLRTLINERFAFGIRMKVFDRIMSANYIGLSKYHSGDLLTRFTSDADNVANSIANAIPSLAMIMVRLLVAFVLLYGYSPFLAVSALLLAPGGLIVSLVSGQRLKRLSVEVRENEAAYRSFVQERVANIAVVKTFCMEEQSRVRLGQLRKRTLDAVLRRNRVSVLMGSTIRVLFSLGHMVSFGYCVFGLFSGTLTYGTMTLFLSLFAQIQQPLMNLGHLLPQAVGVMASAGRIMELEEIAEDPRTGMTHTSDAVSIRFDNVSFSYDRKPVLHDVAFTAEPGQLVGIMGPSGVGKTTLIRLVLSLMQPTGGRVVFSCGGMEEMASADSRRHIAYVPQGNTLLSGTIADNLRYGDPSATEEDMWRALDDAAADFVRDLPDGLNTVIGEKAMGLSEGQAQRIAIARAFLRRKPVLILDEATSALDSASEERILNRLSAPDRAWKPLCLIITHRRSMVPYFDRLVEMNGQGGVQITSGKG